MATESWTAQVEIESQCFYRVPATNPTGEPSRPLRFKPSFSLVGHTDRVDSVAFAPDGRLLASGSRDGTVRLWDIQTRSHIAMLAGHTGVCAGLGSVAFSSDGKILACGCDHGSILIWDVGDRSLLARWSSSPSLTPCSVAFSPRGPVLACNLTDRTVGLFDMTARKHILTIDLQLREPYISCLAFAPDGWTLAMGGWDSAQVTKLEPGFPTVILADTGLASSLAFSPSGDFLLVSGADIASRSQAGSKGFGTAHFYENPPKHRIASLPTDRDTPHVMSLAFHPDGRDIACGYFNGLVRIWYYNALSYEATLTTDEPCHVAFTTDGRALAITSGNAISIWSMF